MSVDQSLRFGRTLVDFIAGGKEKPAGGGGLAFIGRSFVRVKISDNVFWICRAILDLRIDA